MTGSKAFTVDDLRGSLGPGDRGRDVRFFAEIDSTSVEARRMVEAGDASDGAVVVALQQTAGRGTGGKAWQSADAAGLWCTVILLSDAPHPISLMIGAAVVDAIGEVTGGAVAAHLKWPNDVMVGDGSAARKVAGILVETAHAPGAKGAAHLVGIGLNVAQEAFDGALAGRAASLRMVMQGRWEESVTVPRVFGAVMGAIDRHRADAMPVAHRWIERTRMMDTMARIVRRGGEEMVMVRGVMGDGRLVVEREGGRREHVAAATDMDLVWPVDARQQEDRGSASR